jgi:hypothetical protein
MSCLYFRLLKRRCQIGMEDCEVLRDRGNLMLMAKPRSLGPN